MHSKIAIIGCGNVGGATAFAAAMKGKYDLVLLDAPDREGIARAKALDIQQASAAQQIDIKVIGTSQWSAIEGCTLCIITAGLPRSPGMTRDDLLSMNTHIMRNISREIKTFAPSSKIVVVSNPLDAMAQQVFIHTGFEPERVMGMAGLLDTSRLRHLVASAAGCSVKAVSGLVLGAHGDAMVPVLSQCFVDGIPIESVLTSSQIRRIIHRTRNGGGEIVALMGRSAYFAAAQCVLKMVESIFERSDERISASVYVNGQYGIQDLFLGMPVRLGTSGVEEIFELDLTEKERNWLLKSASMVKEMTQKASLL